MIRKLIYIFAISSVLQISLTFPTTTGPYTECDEGISRCFGYPDGCIDEATCLLLMTARPTSSGADFNLYWFRDSKSENFWAGAAISDDDKMGNDSVTECILWPNKTVTARQGLTYGGDSYGVKTVEPVIGITNEIGRLDNNLVWCSWTRSIDTVVRTFDFNIFTNKYYILLAAGPMNGSELAHHKNQSVSADAVYLARPISEGNGTTVEPSNSTAMPTNSTAVPSSTLAPSSTTSTPTGTQPTGSPSPTAKPNYYSDCEHQISRCFGLISDGSSDATDCVMNKSCTILLTAMPTSSGADFNLYWFRDSSGHNRWAGAAISDDKKMGNDSVTECIIWTNNTVTARQGLTYGVNDEYGVNTVEPVRGISNEKGEFSNGVVHCSWSRADNTMIKGLDFDIYNIKYYIFLAMGPILKDDIQHHTDVAISSEAVYLAEPMANTTTATSNTTGTMPHTTEPVTTAHTPTARPPSTTPSGTISIVSEFSFIAVVITFAIYTV